MAEKEPLHPESPLDGHVSPKRRAEKKLAEVHRRRRQTFSDIVQSTHSQVTKREKKGYSSEPVPTCPGVFHEENKKRSTIGKMKHAPITVSYIFKQGDFTDSDSFVAGSPLGIGKQTQYKAVSCPEESDASSSLQSSSRTDGGDSVVAQMEQPDNTYSEISSGTYSEDNHSQMTREIYSSTNNSTEVHVQSSERIETAPGSGSQPEALKRGSSGKTKQISAQECNGQVDVTKADKYRSTSETLCQMCKAENQSYLSEHSTGLLTDVMSWSGTEDSDAMFATQHGKYDDIKSQINDSQNGSLDNVKVRTVRTPTSSIQHNNDESDSALRNEDEWDGTTDGVFISDTKLKNMLDACGRMPLDFTSCILYKLFTLVESFGCTVLQNTERLQHLEKLLSSHLKPGKRTKKKSSRVSHLTKGHLSRKSAKFTTPAWMLKGASRHAVVPHEENEKGNFKEKQQESEKRNEDEQSRSTGQQVLEGNHNHQNKRSLQRSDASKSTCTYPERSDSHNTDQDKVSKETKTSMKKGHCTEGELCKHHTLNRKDIDFEENRTLHTCISSKTNYHENKYKSSMHPESTQSGLQSELEGESKSGYTFMDKAANNKVTVSNQKYYKYHLAQMSQSTECEQVPTTMVNNRRTVLGAICSLKHTGDVNNIHSTDMCATTVLQNVQLKSAHTKHADSSTEAAKSQKEILVQASGIVGKQKKPEKINNPPQHQVELEEHIQLGQTSIRKSTSDIALSSTASTRALERVCSNTKRTSNDGIDGRRMALGEAHSLPPVENADRPSYSADLETERTAQRQHTMLSKKLRQRIMSETRHIDEAIDKSSRFTSSSATTEATIGDTVRRKPSKSYSYRDAKGNSMDISPSSLLTNRDGPVDNILTATDADRNKLSSVTLERQIKNDTGAAQPERTNAEGFYTQTMIETFDDDTVFNVNQDKIGKDNASAERKGSTEKRRNFKKPFPVECALPGLVPLNMSSENGPIKRTSYSLTKLEKRNNYDDSYSQRISLHPVRRDKNSRQLLCIKTDPVVRRDTFRMELSMHRVEGAWQRYVRENKSEAGENDEKDFKQIPQKSHGDNCLAENVEKPAELTTEIRHTKCNVERKRSTLRRILCPCCTVAVSPEMIRKMDI